MKPLKESELTYYQPLVHVVTDEQDGLLLRTLLLNKMGLSRKLLSRLKLTEQGILVNGERRYTNTRVAAGDRVEIRMQEEESEEILPEPMPLAILFEDEHLLILHKPAGIIVHPTHGHYTGTLANGVVHYWREKGENVRFRPIHRLDRETSGVLAVAKTPYVHQHVSAQMMAGTVEKAYTALVRGYLEPAEGTVTGPIDRHPEAPYFRIVTPDGYPAVTHYRVEEAYAAGSVVDIRLETGRTHQIRVHMRHLGHPVIGDSMYGPDTDHPDNPMAGSAILDSMEWNYPIERQALHARMLAFQHPATGERMSFVAPMPEDMEETTAYLRQSKE
ncbi:RluA family pseudouridine synthase [Gorillibacterium massiliense]|uniref:RluA family pseudouridine synthase n=1 Tax=Gorillibacterium massiliense TaxID=1280390 RepID=UPI000592BB97|nr:RluA family pseudouridine synthase [Gorillibacterium massiliense]